MGRNLHTQTVWQAAGWFRDKQTAPTDHKGMTTQTSVYTQPSPGMYLAGFQLESNDMTIVIKQHKVATSSIRFSQVSVAASSAPAQSQVMNAVHNLVSISMSQHQHETASA